MRKNIGMWVLTAALVIIGVLILLKGFAKTDNPVQEARDGVVCVALRADIRGENGKTISEVVSTGTGFFIGERNQPVQYIITNRHVIELDEEDELENIAYIDSVELVPVIVFEQYESSSSVEASIVKKFTSQDLAILRLEIPTTERKALPLSSAESLDVTDEVYALGFPDLSNDDEAEEINAERDDITVTKGNVTKEKAVYEGDDFFQLDAKLSYGNSGGPVLTTDGKVVGIATRISFNANYTETMGAALWVEYLTEYLDSHGIRYDTGSGLQLPWARVILFFLAVGVAVVLLLRKKISSVRRGGSVKACATELGCSAESYREHKLIIGALTPPAPSVSASFSVSDCPSEAEQVGCDAMNSISDF